MQYIIVKRWMKCLCAVFVLIYSNISVAADRVLVFHKVTPGFPVLAGGGFAHPSISDGKEALKNIAIRNGWDIELTDNSADFHEKNLDQYNAVVFLNTTGNGLLNEQEKLAFQEYIESGGGYLGIHAAADAEYDWPWYGESLVGAWFDSHPAVQEATVNIEDNSHPATLHFSNETTTWPHTDEWYNYQMNPRDNAETVVLMAVDENTYAAGEGAMGDHPITWYHNVGQGRSFYTGLGHEPAAYSNSNFLQMISGALSWVGNMTLKPAGAGWQGPPPPVEDFQATRVAENKHRLMNIDIANDGTVYVVGKSGDFFVLENSELNVKSTIPTNEESFGKEGGMIGFALDPNFTTNRIAYLHYAHETENRVVISRITVNTDNTLNLNSEVTLITYAVQNEECCHSAGDMVFDNKGNLYISTGDNTSPFSSGGFAPIDEREDRAPWDAQKSSSNTNDLRGKILRIKPDINLEHGYSIPEENLFGGSNYNAVQCRTIQLTEDNDGGHCSEIYTMGHRNPFRIGIDYKTNQLVWGEIGPDSGSANPNRGPAGYDELNKTMVAGNFGWPYFAGNNEAYNEYDFEEGESGAKYIESNVVNNSPNNTGAESLPNARPAWITMGHQALMTSGVYRFDEQLDSITKLPSYLDGNMIFWNFNDDVMYHVDIDDNSADPDLKKGWVNTSTLDGIIDAKISPTNGHLYVIGWGSSNPVSNCCDTEPDNKGMLVEIKYTGPGDVGVIEPEFFGINAGGNQFTVSDEPTHFSSVAPIIYWPDQFFDGGITEEVNSVITGTENQNLYRTYRWGDIDYDLPLDKGDYYVTFKFAETYFTQSDERVFDVEAEGIEIISNLDVVNEVGANAAYDVTHRVTVKDGTLNLHFVSQKNHPMISAIKVRKASAIDLGTTITFYSNVNGKYAGVGSNNKVTTGKEVAGKAELFVIEDLGNGQVALRSVETGKYLTVLENGELAATAVNIHLHETFEMYENEDGSYSFKSKANNYYLAINSDGVLVANGIDNSPGSPDTRFTLAKGEECTSHSGGAIACRPNAKAYLNMPKVLDRTGNTNAPQWLSGTGAFSDVANLELIESFIPFEPIAPLWSDRAKKTRWVSIPSGTKVVWSENGKWEWPEGTVFVKHFELPTDLTNSSVRRRLETRLLVVQEEGLVYGVSYKWNEDNTDAELLTDSSSPADYMDMIEIVGQDEPQRWDYPTQNDCLSCHNVDAKGVLGAKTASLNGDLTYPNGVVDNQLRTWNKLGIFDDKFHDTFSNGDLNDLPQHANIADESKSLDWRMTSYWDTNCSSCHGPQGIAATWDARFETLLEDKNLLNDKGAEHKDYEEWYGLTDAKIIDPGYPNNSVFYLRDKEVDDHQKKMPPLGRNLSDEVYIDALREWINQLPGLFGYYFDNKDFTSLAFTSTDAQINFDWGTGGQDSRLESTTYSVRWIGKLTPEKSDDYVISTLSDDGVRVWINDELVIDNWWDHAKQWNSSDSISLNANESVDIRIDYYQNTADAGIELHWSRSGFPRELIPGTALSSSASKYGLDATFTHSSDKTVKRIDANIDNDWSGGSPGNGITSDNFEAVWKGEITPEETGVYTFITRSDDRVRLWVNGQKVIENWQSHGPTEDRGNIALTANQPVDFKVEFEEKGIWAVIELEWEKPDGTREIVPMTAFTRKAPE